jgi:hypothetical protein
VAKSKGIGRLSFWTIQDIRWVLELHSAGIGTGDWRFTTQQEKPSYLWMQESMAKRGVLCGDTPPVWAWYTTQKQLLQNVSEFVSLSQLEKGMALVKFSPPVGDVVLSDYGAWCNIYFSLIEDPEKLCDNHSERLVFPLNFSRESVVQATLAQVKKSWVDDVVDLSAHSDLSLLDGLPSRYESLSQFYQRYCS